MNFVTSSGVSLGSFNIPNAQRCPFFLERLTLPVELAPLARRTRRILPGSYDKDKVVRY